MRIKNERIVFILWHKTLVISAKYMATRNKKMSETKMCSNDIDIGIFQIMENGLTLRK